MPVRMLRSVRLASMPIQLIIYIEIPLKCRVGAELITEHANQPEDQKEDDRAEHDENNPVCPQRRQIAKKRFNHDTMWGILALLSPCAITKGKTIWSTQPSRNFPA